MAGRNDLENMVDIITTAIVIHEKEEEYFRRSARTSSSTAAKDLLLEIANGLNEYTRGLEAKKQQFLEELKSELNMSFSTRM